ncbi:MAG: hydrogen peroxide-inducible genes activator [Arenicella sp.]
MFQPTIKQLKYICAVADHQHFSNAAESCFVSQSALSTGINELEQNLGIKIFERHNKTVLITPLGEELVNRARHILNQTNDFVALAQQSSDGFIRQLHLGVIPTIAPFMLPELLQKFKEHHPTTNILIREDLSHNLLSMLNKGDIDVVLLALPFDTQDFMVQELFEDPLMLAMPTEHDLENNKFITLKDLKDVPMLLMEGGHCLRDQALNACAFSIKDINLPYQASSLHTLVQMVANGVGITLLPQMSVGTSLVDDKLVITRKIDKSNISRTIALLWRKNSPNQEPLKALANLLKR